MEKRILKILMWLGIGVVVYVTGVMLHFKINYVSDRHDSPIEEAHQRAVRSFVESRGFGAGRMRRKEYWNDWSVNVDGATYEVDSVQLIGATAEDGPRYFQSFRKPPRKKDVSNTPHRVLTEKEREIIGRLRERKAPYVLEAVVEDENPDVDTRVIAPIFALESCLKCHEAEVGELLGAFDYRLIAQRD